MIEKVFRVMSDSEEHLTAENIAMALLKEITLKHHGKSPVFGVMEVESKRIELSTCASCVTSESQSL